MNNSTYTCTCTRTCKEMDLQVRFFTWIRRLALMDPRLCLVYSVPNEGALGEVRRLRMYRMGATRGVSDINIDLPSRDGKYGYLRIELKSDGGAQTADQLDFQALVGKYGRGKYVVCRSMDDILEALTDYFGPEYAGHDWKELWARYGVKERASRSVRRLRLADLNATIKEFFGI